MPRRRRPLGRYLIAELSGCDAARLDDEPFLREQCVAAALAMGARVVGQHSHRYTPIGVTVVVLLAESHLVLHSFPEHGAASIDAFVCGGAADPARARDALARALRAQRVVDLAVGRGEPASAASARARARAGRGSRR